MLTASTESSTASFFLRCDRHSPAGFAVLHRSVEAQNTPSWGEFLSLRHRRHEVLGARCNLPPEATLCLLLSSTSLVRRPCFWQSNSGYLVLSHTTFGSQNDQLCWSHGIQQPLQIDGLADDIVILSVVIINRLFSNIRVVHHKSHPQTCRPGLIITRRLDPYVVSHSITRVSIGLTTSIQSTPRTDYAKREDRRRALIRYFPDTYSRQSVLSLLRIAAASLYE